MGILGLTHDENGTAFEKLPVTIKVAIGEGPEPGDENGHPIPLDHFIFKRKTLRGRDLVWVPAPEIAQAHAEKPTELGIIFLNDDPREVFRTEYALWTTGSCKCRGELVQIDDDFGPRFEMQAVRKTQKHPEGEPWPGNYKYLDGPKKGQPVEPCGDGCPDLASSSLPSIGGPLLHPGKLSRLWDDLPPPYKQLPLGPQPLEWIDADPTLKRRPSDRGQGCPKGEPRESFLSRCRWNATHDSQAHPQPRNRG